MAVWNALRPVPIVLETWKLKKPVDFQAGKNRLISQLCLLTGNADRAGDRLKRTFLALTPWWLLSQHGEGTA